MVSRMTVRTALEELTKENLLVRKQRNTLGRVVLESIMGIWNKMNG